MKILRNSQYGKDTSPESIKIYQNLGDVLIITMEDINDNDEFLNKNINSMRGLTPSTVLIPKDLGYYENDNMILQKELVLSKLWENIYPNIHGRGSKIIFY